MCQAIGLQCLAHGMEALCHRLVFKHAPGLQIVFDLLFSAAAVLKQMSYKKAVAHEEMVVEVACQAESSGRNRSLGVIFDEVARKHWQEQSGKLGDRFNLEAIVGTRGSDHTMLLERAKDLFDAGKHKAQTLAHYLGLIVQAALAGPSQLRAAGQETGSSWPRRAKVRAFHECCRLSVASGGEAKRAKGHSKGDKSWGKGICFGEVA